jgi:hypothetical protein
MKKGLPDVGIFDCVKIGGLFKKLTIWIFWIGGAIFWILKVGWGDLGGRGPERVMILVSFSSKG